MNNLIDRIGTLMAQIEPLQAELDRLAAELKAQGAGDYVGAHFKGKVIEAHSTEDDKVLRAALKKATADFRATLSTQYLTAHTFDRVTLRLKVDRLLADAVAA